MNFKLALILLFSAPLYAMTMETARAELATDQKNLEDIEAKIQALHTESASHHDKASAVSGSYEKREDMSTHTHASRQKSGTANKLHADLKRARQKLQQTIHRISEAKVGQVVSRDGKYTVEKLPEPQKAGEPVRMPRPTSTTHTAFNR